MTGWFHRAARGGGLYSQGHGGLIRGGSGPQSQGMAGQVCTRCHHQLLCPARAVDLPIGPREHTSPLLLALHSASSSTVIIAASAARGSCRGIRLFAVMHLGSCLLCLQFSDHQPARVMHACRLQLHPTITEYRTACLPLAMVQGKLGIC